MSRRVSLRRELDLLLSCVRGVKVMAERLFDVPMRQYALPGNFASSLIGALVLVEARLRDLERVVAGQVDPDLFWLNETSAEGNNDPDEDHLVFAWSEKRRTRALRQRLKRARRRRHHQHQRSRGPR